MQLAPGEIGILPGTVSISVEMKGNIPKNSRLPREFI